MNNENPVPAGAGPYENLHIYYLEGRIPFGLLQFDKAFIGNWEEDGFTFLFFSGPSDREVEKLLGQLGDVKLLDTFRMTYEQWQGSLPAPFRAGKFFIAPPWNSTPRDPSESGAIRLLLDPGVVFGSGQHPTTSNCLEALEAVFQMGPMGTVLDLGAGTGLLALAAGLLGSPRVLAVDLNFLAARTARRNVCLNGLEDRVLVIQGKAEALIHCPADLLVANIHFDVMKELISSESFPADGYFILSGLLRSQAGWVEDRLRLQGASILRKWHEDGTWHTFLGRRSHRSSCCVRNRLNI